MCFLGSFLRYRVIRPGAPLARLVLAGSTLPNFLKTTTVGNCIECSKNDHWNVLDLVNRDAFANTLSGLHAF